jgi:hypothetical protein
VCGGGGGVLTDRQTDRQTDRRAGAAWVPSVQQLLVAGTSERPALTTVVLGWDGLVVLVGGHGGGAAEGHYEGPRPAAWRRRAEACVRPSSRSIAARLVLEGGWPGRFCGSEVVGRDLPLHRWPDAQTLAAVHRSELTSAMAAPEGDDAGPGWAQAWVDGVQELRCVAVLPETSVPM